jgi:peptidoglycan hydrolase CwlO-like protein
MKKRFLFAAVLLHLTALAAFSQSVSKTITFRDQLRPALQLSLPNESKTADQTILSKLKETGYKPEKSGNFMNKKNKQDGFYLFSGVVLPELTNQKLDLYFKVDDVNNNTTDRSAVTLMVSKGYENFVSQENDSATFNAAQNFLNSFTNQTEMYAIAAQIEDKKKELASSEKKWEDLRNKQEEGRTKIAQLEADLKNWQQEEADRRKDVDAQRTALSDLEAKRAAIHR